MPNEFIIRNGLTVRGGSTTITGSLIATGGITGSFSGIATNATSASYALTASYALSSAGGGITVGTTTITSGTSGRIPFNSGSKYGEDAGLKFYTHTAGYGQTLRINDGAATSIVPFMARNSTWSTNFVVIQNNSRLSGAIGFYNDGLTAAMRMSILYRTEFSIVDENSAPNLYVYPTSTWLINQVSVKTSATPTAHLHIGAGTATANTAPLKLTSGTNLTTPEAGSIEYNGTNLFFTPSSAVRNIVTQVTGSTALSSNSIPYATTNGYLASSTRFAWDNTANQLSVSGALNIGNGNAATSVSESATSNYILFNNNNSQIYDDGNFHIHSRGSGQTMWINTNGGQLNLLAQNPGSGSVTGSGVGIGTGTLIGYVTIDKGKSYTTSDAYGYLTTAGAGTYPGGSQTVSISLYATNRIWGQEIDAFSDERMKNIQGDVSLEEGLKLINTLKPIKYTWKEGEDKGIKIGYSAQQVSKAGFDHLISLIPKEGLEETIDDDGFISPKDTQFSMNYDQVTPYHGVVIKHLLDKINLLEAEILKLKTQS